MHDFSERPTAYNFLHRIADEVTYVRILMFSTSLYYVAVLSVQITRKSLVQKNERIYFL